MRILALDLGTRTGWAWYFSPDHGEGSCGIESGTQDFALGRGESPGMRFIRFRKWFDDMLTEARPELVVYEQPHHRGGAATEILVGMSTRVQELCALDRITVTNCHTGTLKKHATGSGRASKQDMIAAAERWWGKVTTDDNEADALCLLAWALEEFGEGAAHVPPGG